MGHSPPSDGKPRARGLHQTAARSRDWRQPWKLTTAPSRPQVPPVSPILRVDRGLSYALSGSKSEVQQTSGVWPLDQRNRIWRLPPRNLLGCGVGRGVVGSDPQALRVPGASEGHPKAGAWLSAGDFLASRELPGPSTWKPPHFSQ